MNQDKCACKGSFLDKFIQPSILLELHDQNKNGMEILRNINKGTMAAYGKFDPTGFYRTLKKMEEAGNITSKWETQNYIRPVKIYSITETGKTCLKSWEYTLKQYAKDMQELAAQIVETTR